MKKKIIFLFGLNLLVTNLWGQSLTNPCGIDELHKNLMETDPAYSLQYPTLQNSVHKKIKQGAQDKSTIYTIPVVVHVVHLGESIGMGTNISAEQIHAAIKGLNDRFSGATGNGVDVGIIFCLAVRDPNGCSTDGINRVNGSGVQNYAANGIARANLDVCGAPSNETAVKDLSRWPPSDYYNIWVVNKVCGGFGGYAYYPIEHINDGTVIDNTKMTYSSSYLTHELGHGFNLMHTFEGDKSGCPLNSNCSFDGDQLCDTPPHREAHCASTNPCTNSGTWDNSRYNYMSYCFPSIGNGRFTTDAKNRMRATLSVNPRARLLHSKGCLPGFNVTVTQTNIACSDFCNGAITVTPTCPSNYTFLWNTGATTQSINSLCAGTYAVAIRNSNNITENVSVTISEPSSSSTPFSVTINQTNVSCFEGNNGNAAVNVSGGAPPFTYEWSNGETTPSISNLPAGNYSVVVTGAGDNNMIADPPLCTPGTKAYCCGFGIYNVTLSTINNSSQGGEEGYRNFENVIAYVDKEQSYELSVQTGGDYNENVRAWIDYDKNGVFEAAELILTSQNWIPDRFHRSVVTIPENAPLGALRMRVASDVLNDINPSPQPCSSVLRGQFEDYTVYIKGRKGCERTASVQITQPTTQPTAEISQSGPTTFCPGDNVTLTANEATGYLWSNGAAAKSITVSSDGNYSVTIMDGNGCTATSPVTTVAYRPLPTATIIPSGSISICEGENVALTVGSATSYIWSNNSTMQSITVSIPGSYSVTVTDQNGCTATSSVTTVTLNPNPTATISKSGTTIFCQGDSVLLTANAGSGYQWSNGNTTQSIVAHNSGNYSVEVANSCGTANSPITSVTVNPLPEPTMTVSGPTTFCQGNTVTLTSNQAADYVWSNGAITKSITVSTPGSYSVSVMDENGCSATAPTTTVVVNPLPPAIITPSGPTTFCQGNTVTLTSNQAADYVWSNGAITKSITVSSSGSYSVRVMDGNGCSTTSLATPVVVNPLPTATITASRATTFCQGDSVTLTANEATGYLWSNGGTTRSIKVSTSGIYSVTVMDGNGCSATSPTTTVVVNPLPTATITPSGATIFCQGNSVALTTNEATSYLWSNGGTTKSINVSTSGIYSVTVMDGNGCTTTSPATTVVVNPLPTATITPSGATIFCQGDSVTLKANVGISYLWSNGATTQSIVVHNTGIYSVEVTNFCGTANSPTKSITLNPLPKPTVMVSGSSIYCLGNSFTLSCSITGTNYLWSNGATSQSITAFTNGNYAVEVTDANGCKGRSIDWSVNYDNQTPPPSVDAGTTVTIFAGNSTVIGSNPTATGLAPFIFNWTPTTGLDVVNVANPTASPMETILYTVLVTDANGCKNSDSVLVTVKITGDLEETMTGGAFKIAPNPTNKMLNISASTIENGEYRFELRNVIGTSIFIDNFTISNQSVQKQYSISQLSMGMYFLIIENGKNRTVLRVQIIH